MGVLGVPGVEEGAAGGWERQKRGCRESQGQGKRKELGEAGRRVKGRMRIRGDSTAG